MDLRTPTMHSSVSHTSPSSDIAARYHPTDWLTVMVHEHQLAACFSHFDLDLHQWSSKFLKIEWLGLQIHQVHTKEKSDNWHNNYWKQDIYFEELWKCGNKRATYSRVIVYVSLVPLSEVFSWQNWKHNELNSNNCTVSSSVYFASTVFLFWSFSHHMMPLESAGTSKHSCAL